MKKFAVFGHPISHSKSPIIHTKFARQFELEIDYQKQLAPLDGFKEALLAFSKNNGIGCNITVPFKQEAFRLCHQLTPRAELAAAVNTIKINNHQFLGDNTDGQGLVNDFIDNLNLEIKDKTILILGAGGATQGILSPLLAQSPKHIMIANRTPEKAQQLAKKFSNLGKICSFSLEKIKAQPVDILINATSASLSSKPLNLPNKLVDGAICYDLMYGNSYFLNWAKENGAKKVYDGLGMLVEQAALSFTYWLDKIPNTKPVIESLR